MTTSAGTKSDVAVLLKAARANGYKTVPAAGGHKKLVDKHGRPVVDSKGPLIISGTPGDHRWRDMHVKRWLAAGVLKSDPFESQQKGKATRGGLTAGKDGGNRLADPDIQEKKVAAIKAKAAGERAETQKLREIIEPIVVKIGGWGAGGGGKVTQIADVAFWFNEWRGHVDTFSGQSAARGAMQNLKGGKTLNERNRKAVAFFLDELVKQKDPAARYFELYRLSKGLPAREEDETIRGGDQLPDPLPKEERDRIAAERAAAKTNGNGSHGGPSTKPTLALEAVAQMMVGRTEVDETILKIGERIQDMELRERGLA